MKFSGFQGNTAVAARSALAGLALVLSSTSAMAQPVSVDPAQVEKRFNNAPSVAPQSAPNLTVSTPEAKQTAKQREALAKKRFTLKSVSVQGNSAIATSELQPLYADKIGKDISMLDAQNIARAITKKYRAHGYVLSDASVASQNVKGGELKITVREGHISNVNVQGDVSKNDFRDVVNDYAQELKAARPVKNTDIERFLLLVDDLPGATAKGAVRPSTTTPGAADLGVVVTHKPFEGSYTIDNRGSKFIGPLQHTVALAANSLFGMYDRTVLRGVTTTPMSELRFIDLFHQQPVGSEGTKLGFIVSHARTEPGYTLKSSLIEAESSYLQLNATHPLMRTRKETLTARAAFDLRNTDIEQSNVTTSKDKLRVARVGAAYDFADRFDGASLIDAEISQGFDVFGASGNGDLVSRTATDSEFTKVNLDLARTQYLPWEGFSLFTAAAGQWASDRVLAAEQFSIGGVNFGRGYNPTEISGDHGVAAKAEVRYSRAANQPYLNVYQVYGFYDVGTVWTRGVSSDRNSLASTGLGVRANFTPNLAGNVEVAFPMTRDVTNQGDDPRFFFGASASF